MSVPLDITTVADDEVVLHRGGEARRYRDLAPATRYDFDGVTVTTLPRLGERLATVTTVNDLHFGETQCGEVEGFALGEVMRADAGGAPYPEVMNRSVVADMAAIAPDAVVAKGDLTDTGTPEQYADFLALYEGTFGARLHHVRGNHDAYSGTDIAAGPFEVAVPGAVLAVLDTVDPGEDGGTLGDQLEWLDEVAQRSDRPVLVLGHHHIWNGLRPPGATPYFGLDPTSSTGLRDVIARRPAIVGYFSGHTHRNRKQHLAATGPVPYVEVAAVKDFPGSWAEYRIFEGAILQVHRRASDPEAVAWAEKTRSMFGGSYESYALGRPEDRSFVIPLRR